MDENDARRSAWLRFKKTLFSPTAPLSLDLAPKSARYRLKIAAVLPEKASGASLSSFPSIAIIGSAMRGFAVLSAGGPSRLASGRSRCPAA
jgi:hypothetical protein